MFRSIISGAYVRWLVVCLVAVVAACGPSAGQPSASLGLPSPTATPITTPSPIESPTPSVSPTPGGSPTIAPSLTTEFARPFSYVLPVDNSIRTAPPTEQLFQFIDGSFTGRHGMVVAAIARASVARCPGTLGAVPIRNAPAALLEDLGAIGGFTLPSPTEGTVDGRVATVTRRNEDSSPCSGEFHIEAGLASDSISMTRPGTMILFDVDGETVLIDVWAINEAELESWLPTAMELVDTIHFVPPPPAPTTEFGLPFSYVLPVDNSIRAAAPTEDLFEFIDGSLSGRHGIVVAAIDDAVVHDCTGGRAPIRIAPTDMLEDLGAIGGITLAAPGETTFDGRVATVTRRVEASHACETPDIHLNGRFFGSTIDLLRPGSMILFEVDERTILIDIWAIDNAELDRWLPTAMEFVDSFHFIEQRSTTSEFARPFTYAVPSGVSPLWVSRDVDLYGFVDSTREIQPDDSRYGPAQPNNSPRGIVLVSVSDLWIPVCRGIDPGRVEMRNTPAGFLEDLDVSGGLELGPITSTVVDGFPALTTALAPATSACTSELKLGPTGGLGERYVATEPPSQFFVFEVRGTTILVDVWARTDSALESWLPTAMEFVNSIHFISEP